LRTFLTILGIVIGITSVITLLNVGQAAQKSLQTSFSAFGSNLIAITPGKINTNSLASGVDLSSKFTTKDVDALINATKFYVEGISAQNSRGLKSKYKTNNFSGSVTGVYGDYWNVNSVEIDKGRELGARDNNTLEKVAVIGPDLTSELFGDEDPIGKQFTIGNQTFTVVGVTKAKGSSGISNPDELIYIPLTTLQKFLSGDDRIQVIYAKVKDSNVVDAAQSEIQTILRRERNLKEGDDNDFTIRNSVDALNFISQLTSIFTVFLAAIGAISLLVGGIGIMNIMFVTVRERTKEIGLRKSLGATKNDILLQFLAEATVVTLLGGIVGVILGTVLTYIFTSVAGIGFEIYPNSIILAVGVSAIIGLVFGIYPAYNAAQLNPIDALRYE
jgi:putative ABC transport system permease protein